MANDNLKLKKLSELNLIGTILGTEILPTLPPGGTTTLGITVNQLRATLAPLNSAVLTGNPTAPTQPTTDISTKLATTQFVDQYWDVKYASNKQLKQIITAVNTTSDVSVSGTTNISVLSQTFTPVSSTSNLIITVNLASISHVATAANSARVQFGWSGTPQIVLSGTVAQTSTADTNSESISHTIILPSTHGSLGTSARTYQVYIRQNAAGGTLTVNTGGGYSNLSITEVLV
ncbi:hypothetical protein H6G93_09200 [Nostoc sp. FACHB-973]|nr:hypothetical protein [Nostoc sp. FACHB-973]